jgi:L-glyceraldehyde reductase
VVSYIYFVKLRGPLKIHWPIAFPKGSSKFPTDQISGRIQVIDVPIADTWKALEALVQKGKVRSIGVSNFTKEKVEALLST